MRSILNLIKTILLSFFQALPELVKVIRAACRRQRRQPKDPRERKAAKTRCVPIEDPAFVKPDPLIYDQYYLMSLGLNVTWNNPDFAIFHNGVQVDSGQLQRNTEYDVVVRVWNGSVDCPVVMMPVHLSYLSFGVGTTSHPIATKKIDIGVKGTATNPGFLHFAWRTPDVDGHYCLQAHLDPVTDVNFGNNLGQHNTNVVETHSPAVFSFDLYNDDADNRHQYRFEYDGYTLGALLPCGERGEPAQDKQQAHAGDVPLPAGWTVQISPDHPTVAAHAHQAILVTVTPPPGFTGEQTVNVHTFKVIDDQADKPVGGVTVKVTAT